MGRDSSIERPVLGQAVVGRAVVGRATRPLRACLLVIAAGLAPVALTAQTAAWEPPPARENPFELTIRNIMRGPELVGDAPSGVRWSDDGAWVYFRWLPGGEPWHAEPELYRVSAGGGEPERVPEELQAELEPLLARGDVSPDGEWRAVSSGGDLYLIDREAGAARRLTVTEESEFAPEFAADGERIFFRRDQNLFALDIEDATIEQLTRIASGPAAAEEREAEGQRAFLERQQEELFEHIRIELEREARREARTERREEGEPEALHLERGERAISLDPAPDGSFVAVTASRDVGEERRTDIPRWITRSGYTENTEMRAKVGDEGQATRRIGIIRTETGEVRWLDLPPSVDERAGEGENEEEEDDRLSATNFVGWDETGTWGLAYAVDVDQERWRLYAIEAETGDTRILAAAHDEAWIGGPCIPRCAGWIPAGGEGTPRAWYVSEETGYAHLYTVDADGSDRRALTSGEWEVLGVEIPEGGDAFLLHTSERSPFDRHPWRVSFDGSDRRQLLAGPGAYDATPSPDGSRLAVIHSRANRPPELYLADAAPGADMERVTLSPTEEWLAFDWIEPEIVRFEARDGTRVPARIYRPRDLRAEPNGAGVVFVHGAGYLHNVHNWWSSYYREYMFHHFLAASGYTVLDIDYRGSAGYGRDWRTAIYRHMGGWDLSDQVDGAEYLVREEGVDPDRLGIYGGSYGGFITLMALFTEPEVFEAGAALRSVTDWAHYNHPYTSRILNLPQEDEEAYRRSSPIYFAEGLEGHLLIAHGMYDTNVHFSDVVRLVQRLIELGKEDWELAVYPVENHSFVEPSSWTDEYRRIYELFERVIGGGGGRAAEDGGP